MPLMVDTWRGKPKQAKKLALETRRMALAHIDSIRIGLVSIAKDLEGRVGLEKGGEGWA